jgi:3-hydroxyisobutyrate dehydrogenase-like beta-hydroxyacid dehydrogenase
MFSKVGFIGLGAMGLPMTAMLARHGIAMTVFDLDPAARERAADLAGVEAAASAEAVAGAVQALFTCLPNDAVVRAVYLGQGGIAGAIGRDAVTVDCSTVGPGVTGEVAAAMAARGAAHLDAAMLGSTPQAESGEIGFVVGGEPAAFERAGPLLDILGRFRKHAGPSGAGHRLKLIHQVLVATHAAAVAEATALCLASGTDLDCFFEVVCDGGGFAHSRYFEKRLPRMRAGDFSPLFMLELMAKDVTLAQGLARNSELATPLLDRVLELFDKAKGEGWGREDFSAVAHLYEAAPGRKFA